MVLYIVSCGVFAPELEKILPEVRRELPGVGIETLYLPQALHNSFKQMETGVTEALKKLAGQKILLLYGSMCHPHMADIAGEFAVVHPEGKNCIEVLAGPEKKKEMDAAGKIFYLSAGWLRNLREWDVMDKWFTIGGITKIVALDDGCCAISETTRLEFSDKLHVPVEVETLSLDYFTDTMVRMCRIRLSERTGSQG
jgi:hypothetical protein